MIVIDTHALVWAVSDDEQLGPAARETITASATAGGVLVSAITPWEIAMLVQKDRLALGRDLAVWIDAALALPGIVLATIAPAIAIDSVRLPGQFHADPADRLIVATARHHGGTLLTADHAILAYGAAGHVRVADART